MNERVRNFDALEDNVDPGRQEIGPRAPTMRERVAVWANEGGAGGDEENQTGAPARESPQRLYSSSHGDETPPKAVSQGVVADPSF
jgi:hypothetical protein